MSIPFWWNNTASAVLPAPAAPAPLIVEAPTPSAAESVAIHRLMREPAYLDRNHPGHAAAVAEVSRAYALAAPTPGVAPPVVAAADASRAEIARLMEAPSYRDPNAFDHASAVAAVTAACERAATLETQQ